MFEYLVPGLVLFGTLSVLWLAYKIFSLRRVVSTNEVHIVQTRKNTTSYGKDTGHGNTYYEWPSWLPLLGITKIVLPVSVFDLDLTNYEAYDKGRLPFMVDIKAFFRITESNIAAERVASFSDLQDQLKAIVQGAVRTILASNEIESIMQGRATFGQQFTDEVSEQLANWGVSTVKNIELMDIRDAASSNVIKNIMEKKKSFIEMESRIEVARNHQLAEVSEIEAKQKVDLEKQTALQTVGLRTVETEKQVAISKQSAVQLVKEQELITSDKEMNIVKLQQVRNAEIVKEVGVVQALQQKETAILVAEGKLESQRREAEAITLNGEARASAEKALQLAPVEAQIVLAKEIGQNESYQKYLVTIRQVEASQAVGIEQAKALEKADVKIISNTSSPTSGLTNVRELFSSKGGMEVGAMLEGLANTEKGKAVLKALNITENKS